MMPLKEIDRSIREQAQWTTKHLRCPDGVSRVVTMGKWYWTCFDWLCERGYCEKEYVLSWILNMLDDINEVDYEEQFQACLQGCIFEGMRRVFPMLNVGHPDNDNNPHY